MNQLNDTRINGKWHSTLWSTAIEIIVECARDPVPDDRVKQMLATTSEFILRSLETEGLAQVRGQIEAIAGHELGDIKTAISLLLDHAAGPGAAALYFERIELLPPIYMTIEEPQEIVEVENPYAGSPIPADAVVHAPVDERDLRQFLVDLGRIPTYEELLQWAGVEELANELFKLLTPENLDRYIEYLEKYERFCETNGSGPRILSLRSRVGRLLAWMLSSIAAGFASVCARCWCS
jgi:hypothetical protein